MSLMKKLPLDIQQLCMARSYEVVKSPFNVLFKIRQASYVCCVNTYVSRW